MLEPGAEGLVQNLIGVRKLIEVNVHVRRYMSGGTCQEVHVRRYMSGGTCQEVRVRIHLKRI
jgi:hypothetical protein